MVLFLTLGLTAAFGEIVLEPAFTANATMTWGVDLNAPVSTGFTTVGTANVLLKFLVGEAIEKGADEKVYGWIKVSNVNWAMRQNMGSATPVDYNDSAWDGTGDAMGLEAKLMMDPLWVKIYARPGMSFNWAADAEGIGVADGVEVGYTYDDVTSPTVGGVTVGGTFGPASIELYLASENDWNTNVDNAYSIGAKPSATFGPITVAAYALMGFNYVGDAEDIGFGLSADFVQPIGDFDLKVGADADMLSPEVGAFAFEVAFYTDLIFFYNADGDAVTQLNLDVSYSDPVTQGDLDVKVAVANNASFGFVPNLAFAADALIKDILGTNTMGADINVSGSYNMNGIKPGFAAGYDMGVLSVDLDEVFDASAYLELGGLVPNTTFTLKYASVQLLDGKTLSAQPAQDLGDITFATKIAY
jgi:hypothetical protein